MITFSIPEPLSGMRTEIIDTLKKVIDPELHLNIVDLGLVYHISVDDRDKYIVVEMTLSSRNCPMSESIVSGVKNCISGTFAVYQPQVFLVWEPEWNYNSISPEGIRMLQGC